MSVSTHLFPNEASTTTSVNHQVEDWNFVPSTKSPVDSTAEPLVSCVTKFFHQRMFKTSRKRQDVSTLSESNKLDKYQR